MPTEGRKAMVNRVAQEFWSEVFNLHAPIEDYYPRPKGTSKLRAKRIRRVVREARIARAS